MTYLFQYNITDRTNRRSKKYLLYNIYRTGQNIRLSRQAQIITQFGITQIVLKVLYISSRSSITNTQTGLVCYVTLQTGQTVTTKVQSQMTIKTTIYLQLQTIQIEYRLEEQVYKAVRVYLLQQRSNIINLALLYTILAQKGLARTRNTFQVVI